MEAVKQTRKPMNRELVLMLLSYPLLRLLMAVVSNQFAEVGGFGFPVFLAGCQRLATTLVLLPVLLASWDPREDTLHKRHLPALLLIGLAQAAMVLFQSGTPFDITAAPEHQMAQAFIPLLAYLLTLVRRNALSCSLPHKEESLALVLVGVGGAAMVFSSTVLQGAPLNWAPLHIAFSQMDCVAGAAVLAISAGVVTELGVLELTFYSSAITSALLVPIFLSVEYNSFKMAVQEGAVDMEFPPLLLASCLLAVCQPIIVNRLLQNTSAVFVAVVEEAWSLAALLGATFMSGLAKVRAALALALSMAVHPFIACGCNPPSPYLHLS
eukprot:CAMPEP_0117683624 /NCGR_PEP_ID=MMETSP0804-20121206/20533_1 /TAXON_ID=1074897 /ORGANISM="Tetraselmis astigmatica, Strain CCMP880" /LENGTH=324 /DNA_ID=CAMNT_0005494297 /DNA_START=55 /DNA_END=1029 /DNA_ORIENTATION=-